MSYANIKLQLTTFMGNSATLVLLLSAHASVRGQSSSKVTIETWCLANNLIIILLFNKTNAICNKIEF